MTCIRCKNNLSSCADGCEFHYDTDCIIYSGDDLLCQTDATLYALENENSTNILQRFFDVVCRNSHNHGPVGDKGTPGNPGANAIVIPNLYAELVFNSYDAQTEEYTYDISISGGTPVYIVDTPYMALENFIVTYSDNSTIKVQCKTLGPLDTLTNTSANMIVYDIRPSSLLMTIDEIHVIITDADSNMVKPSIMVKHTQSYNPN